MEHVVYCLDDFGAKARWGREVIFFEESAGFEPMMETVESVEQPEAPRGNEERRTRCRPRTYEGGNPMRNSTDGGGCTMRRTRKQKTNRACTAQDGNRRHGEKEEGGGGEREGVEMKAIEVSERR